jgi:hypothetical protein
MFYSRETYVIGMSHVVDQVDLVPSPRHKEQSHTNGHSAGDNRND